jgi:hypothetical protein
VPRPWPPVPGERAHQHGGAARQAVEQRQREVDDAAACAADPGTRRRAAAQCGVRGGAEHDLAGAERRGEQPGAGSAGVIADPDPGRQLGRREASCADRGPAVRPRSVGIYDGRRAEVR